MQVKSQSQISHRPINKNEQSQLGQKFDNQVGDMYAVQRAYDGCNPKKLVYKVDPLMGINEAGIDPTEVYGAYLDEKTAMMMAEKICNEFTKASMMLEKKKQQVVDKLKEAIDQLEDKRRDAIAIIKENPKDSGSQKDTIAQLATKIDDLMTKLEKIEKSKKEIEEKEDDKKDKKSKKRLEESILGTIALGATVGMGINWINKKKKQFAKAEEMQNKSKLDANARKEEDARLEAREAAIEKAEATIKDPKNQAIISKIKSDRDIQGWIKEIDKKLDDSWRTWEQSGGNSSYGMGYMTPSWGEDSKDLVKKIEDRVKTFEGGKEILNLMSTTKGGLSSKLKN
jgi:hypothetical protein